MHTKISLKTKQCRIEKQTPKPLKIMHVAVLVDRMNSHQIKIQNQNKQKVHASGKGKRFISKIISSYRRKMLEIVKICVFIVCVCLFVTNAVASDLIYSIWDFSIQNAWNINRYHLYTSRQQSSSDEEDWDTPIDVKLKQSAKRNNLTPQNVKNILQVRKFTAFFFDYFNTWWNMWSDLFFSWIDSIESG